MEGIDRPFLGLDYGDRTVGVSISDPLGMMAHGIETIHQDRPGKLRKTLARIEALVQDRNVKGIVLGLPLLADGAEGERCEKTREFGALLGKRLKLPILYQDERLSTREAYEYMRESGVPAAKREGMVDEVAAVIILQDYLDSHGRN